MRACRAAISPRCGGDCAIRCSRCRWDTATLMKILLRCHYTLPLRFESTAMSLRKFLAGQNNRYQVAIMKNPIRFYYDLGAFTTLLLRSCRFCYDSGRFDQKYES